MRAVPGRIRVRKPPLFQVLWEVDNGRTGFYCRSWRQAIDLALKWACTGEHP